jgi:signal transduction histidine kinase
MGLDQNNDEITRKGWHIVEKNQSKISTLVMDMLTISKEREPDLSPADLNQVVGDVVELMQSRAAESKVTLDWRPDPSMPVLQFDTEGIHRAVLNVVTNAIDACDQREAAKVDVSTMFLADEQLAHVIVEDNGCGIDPDQLPKIFQLFVSGKGARGTGLGLPVSQKIVKEHGGQIHVESQVDRGTKFVLELPTVIQPPVNDEQVRQTNVATANN